jgi:predicted TPR repeat methyltransferase
MMHLAVYQVLKEQRKNKVSVRVEGCQLMAGERFEHFLIENRGYYVKLTDPELVRELVEELDDADKLNSYLDEWR